MSLSPKAYASPYEALAQKESLVVSDELTGSMKKTLKMVAFIQLMLLIHPEHTLFQRPNLKDRNGSWRPS